MLIECRSRARCWRYVDLLVGSFIGTFVDISCQQQTWEVYATRLANAETDDELANTYLSIAKEANVKMENPARVIYARDTRASGSRLVGALIEGLKATGVEYTDYRLLTTPQLHYMVRCINTKGTVNEYGEPSEKGYYEKTAAAFKAVMQGWSSKGHVTVDCANGVGGPKLQELVKYLPSAKDGGVDIKVVNDEVHRPDELNHDVS